MNTVFVSGAYRIIHPGHVAFFKKAREYGDRLVVCIASDKTLEQYKQPSPLTLDQRCEMVRAIRHVDSVLVGSNEDDVVMNFVPEFEGCQPLPAVLVVTSDDKHIRRKLAFCQKHGAKLVVMNKSEMGCDELSTTFILTGRTHVPLRVDFGGGWLDVPQFARVGSYICNCTISPLVSRDDYEPGSGLGGSAAYALLTGKNPVQSELTIAGWQDAAVILETGLCVWRSGASPVLEAKFNPDFLQNKMALYWTGKRHSTLDISRRIRDLDKIASVVRHPSKWTNPMEEVVRMVEASYECQRDEGMDAIKKVKGMLASKYCGSGWGGYILYLFNSVDDTIWFCSSCDGAMAVEPYMRQL